jgi:hypothetical protein
VDSAQSFSIQLVDLALYYIRKLVEERAGEKVSSIHREVFPRLGGLIHSLDSLDRGSEIIGWVEQEHAKGLRSPPKVEPSRDDPLATA